MVLLDDFYGRGIGNFRVLGQFHSTQMDLGVNILQAACAKSRTASRLRQGQRAHICLVRSWNSCQNEQMSDKRVITKDGES